MATSSNFCTREQAVPLPVCPPLDVGFMTHSSCDYKTIASYTGDVLWGSNLDNRDGLGAVTGVPGHAHAAPS